MKKTGVSFVRRYARISDIPRSVRVALMPLLRSVVRASSPRAGAGCNVAARPRAVPRSAATRRAARARRRAARLTAAAGSTAGGAYSTRGRPDVAASRVMRSLLSAAAIALAAPATALAATPQSRRTTCRPGAGSPLALDLDRVVLAEDPVARGACPVVRFAQAPAPLRRLGTDAGPTCRSGGRFWVRPGVRAIGVALDRALWTLVPDRPARAPQRARREGLDERARGRARPCGASARAGRCSAP